MEGSKTLKERLYLINNVDKLFFNSKWSQKRFLQGQTANQQHESVYKKRGESG